MTANFVYEQDFGTDISTATIGPDGRPDIDPMFKVISGPRVVLEAVARRLQTPRGMLEDDPGFGFDVASLLNGSLDAATIRHLIRSECEDDERVSSARVELDFSSQSSTLRVKIELDLGVGIFPLVLTYDQLTSKVRVIFPYG